MSARIKKTYRKWFLTKVKKAVTDFKMLETDDRLAVGLSGGLDSSVLLYVLVLLRQDFGLFYNLEGVHLDLGWGVDTSSLESFCRELEVPLHKEFTRIGEIVFQRRREKNPCALCAHLRRGALHRVASARGCNKVVLGHHLDDAVETFFLNLLYNGKPGTFSPRVYLDRSRLTLIRPLAYLEKKVISDIARTRQIPQLKNPCPASDFTKREEIRELVSFLADRYPDLRRKCLTAFRNKDAGDFWAT